jgi:replicative DNA helicase
MIEQKLLSKIIDEKQFYITHKFGVSVHDFEDHADIYEFIHKITKSEGAPPDFRTVIEKFPKFEYEPEVADSFRYLCSELKSRTGKRMSFEMLQHRAKKAYKEMEGADFVAWLAEESRRIKNVTAVDFSAGSNFAKNGEERLRMYEEGKDPNNQVILPTPFDTLNDIFGGGLEVTEYLLLLAFTNVGKSWYASKFGVHAWRKGHTVLHYSPELSSRQQQFRLDTLDGQFDNQALRRGGLFGVREQEYKDHLSTFNPDDQENDYIVKTMEDLPNGLSCDVIEADLQMHPDVDMVIVDGFNLMVHEKGDGTRNKMTGTSRRLRQIFGRHKVVGVVVHQVSAQSQKDKLKEDEDGMRIIEPPEITDFSETSAVIQDASTVLTLDAYEGIAKLACRKAREPKAVGQIIENVVDFNNGIIKEQSDIEYFEAQM